MIMAEVEESILVARRTHRKSRNGCRQCKIRKVKCDERRPVCSKCAVHYANIRCCDWPESNNEAKPSASSRSVSQKQPSRGNVQRDRYRIGDERESSNSPATTPGPLISLSSDPYEVLLKHYHTVFAFYSFPFLTKAVLDEIWWPTVLGDELLYHTVLLLSALHLEKKQQQWPSISSSTDWRPLMRKCINILRSKVNESGPVQVETTVSVALLAAVAADRGDAASMKMHAEGLTRMIYLHRGILAIRAQDPLSANIIAWICMTVISGPESVDLLNALGAYKQQPSLHCHTKTPNCPCLLPELDRRFPDIHLNHQQNKKDDDEDDEDGNDSPEIVHRQDLEEILSSSNTLNLRTLFFPKAIFSVATIRDINTHLAQTNSKTNSQSTALRCSQFIQVFTEICGIMSHLLDATYNRAVGSTFRSNLQISQPMYQTYCMACAIFILTPLRSVFPDPSLLINSLIHKLREELTKNFLPMLDNPINIPSSSGTDPSSSSILIVPLFLLCIGASASLPSSPERKWFLAQMLTILDRLQIDQWSQMRRIVRYTVWNDSYCEELFKSMWDEAQKQKEDMLW